MSLQTYDFALDTANAKFREISAQGRYIYYVAGTTPNITAAIPGSAGNQRLKVTPSGGGASILLMPGQSYRLPDSDKVPSTWKIENYVNAETITGTIYAGEGDFHDDNINAAVTLAATQVLNAAALPVQPQAWSTITNIGVVVVGVAAALLVSDATQRCLRIRNTSLTATVYLGANGVTIANAGVMIPPGGTWIETEAPGAAWYAISDTAGTNVAIQGLKL